MKGDPYKNRMGTSINPPVPVVAGPLPIPRLPSRWQAARVPAGGIVVVALLIVAMSFSANEPLREHMERTLNATLQGYTVHLTALAFSPFGFSITLKDLTISQDAHPQPPVAEFPELRASVY